MHLKFDALKHITVFCILLTAGYLTQAQPVFETDKGQSQFLGTLYPSDRPFIHEFTIYNRGDYELEIYSIESDCGCTKVSKTDTIIAPGDSTRISFAIKTKRMSFGPNSTTVSFFTNDPVVSDYEVTLGYDYYPAVALDRTGLAFGLMEQGEKKEVKLQMLNYTPYVLKVKRIEHTDAKIKYDLKVGDIIDPLNHRFITFTYDTKYEGPIDNEFKIYFDHPHADPLVFAVDGMVVNEKSKRD